MSASDREETRTKLTFERGGWLERCADSHAGVLLEMIAIS